MKTLAEQTADLVEHLDDALKLARKRIEAHAAAVMVDPVEALASDSIFESAAKIRVFGNARRPLTRTEKPVSTSALYALAIEHVLRMSRHPTRSTSVTRNLSDQFELAAWADLEEVIRWRVG